MTYSYSDLDFKDKAILVTGGTGSFGRSIVQELLDNLQPRRLIIFSRDEQKQYEMAMRMNEDETSKIRFFIGDVRDVDRLKMAMRGVDIVIHAAALKHVPTSEYNPFECIKTNVHGAENIVRAALDADVEKVIALSTDKAVNPINLYGASKLAADKIIVAANNLTGLGRTRFSVVRYGNVIGSRGSVVPLFRRLIAEGATELPITHAEMTRFWITLHQGVNFVLSSLGMMRGGEIFVPKIPSMRITDLATIMAPDLPQTIIGIRPGEKLHEALLTEHDSRTTYELPDRYTIEPELIYWTRENRLPEEAELVAPNFSYSSDNNVDWLDADKVRAILETAELTI